LVLHIWFRHGAQTPGPPFAEAVQKVPGQQSVESKQVVGFWQQTPLVHVCVEVQQVLPHAVVPEGHSHLHVCVLKTCVPVHAGTQAPVPGQISAPGVHAHCSVAGSQNSLQHSMFWRHTVPFLRHRPGAIASAPPAPTSASRPPAPVVIISFRAWRRDVVVENAFVASSNLRSFNFPPSPADAPRLAAFD
jgi:hypothetical protein